MKYVKYAREMDTGILHVYLEERKAPGGMLWSWACARVRDTPTAMFGVPEAWDRDVTCLWCLAEMPEETS